MKCMMAEKKITSSTFYGKMAPQIMAVLDNMEIGKDVVVDLSKTVSVDAMAVPLLLNTARLIIGQKGTIPQLYIPNLAGKKDLKIYLERIGFFNTCDFYDYYEINTERMSVKMNQTNFATYIFTDNAKCDLQEEKLKEIPYVDKLMEIRGIGLVTVSGFIAEVGDIGRFDNPKQLQKLAGYAIVSNDSGKHNGESRISYRGRKRLRYVLYEAAVFLVGKNAEFKAIHEYYRTRRENPLKKMQSVVAVACKILSILHDTDKRCGL